MLVGVAGRSLRSLIRSGYRSIVMGNSGSSSSSSSFNNDPRRVSRSRGYEGSSSQAYGGYSHPSSSRYGDAYEEPPSEPPYVPRPVPKKPLKREFSFIRDNYSSVEEVQNALGQAGMESSNLIVGIDFTKSNEWTGKNSYGGRSLHAIGGEPNPYEKALSIIGRTLPKFDDDNLIPCFGFGDSTTHDKYVFSFNADHRPCEGFEEVFSRYRTIVPHLRLAGPTSFAPIINAAIDIVEESGGQYHLLIIIADGQVTRSVDVAYGQQSPQEAATIRAIVNASSYPLSIVLVGVGDGPWDMMREFDDNLPERSFDNFQFVNFTEIMNSRNLNAHQKEAKFALNALMEIPLQYRATLELSMLGNQVGTSPGIKPLPPPPKVLQNDGIYPGGNSRQPQQPTHKNGYPNYNHGHYSGGAAGGPPPSSTRDYHPHSPHHSFDSYPSFNNHNYSTQPSAPASSVDGSNMDCPVCLTDRKDMAFNCGHQTCRQCGVGLLNCPMCRQLITTRIHLY